MSDNSDLIELENPDFVTEPGKTDVEDTIMDNPFNPKDINIIAKSDTLGNLIARLKHDEIDLNTEFQRHADLWNEDKMSRLIESILIRFPLPAFYFDASEDDKWLVVDGLQRLSSIKKFVIDGQLKLRKLEYLGLLEGKEYKELERIHTRRIDECQVTLFLIQPGTPDEVKYSIFRRINTGGLVLNDQEIRNAMISEKTRELLSKLALDEYFKKTMGDRSKRMVDQELVLRFLAFNFLDYSKSRKNIASFLDRMVALLEKASDDEKKLYQNAFSCAVKRCWEVFGEKAFEKHTGDQNDRRRRKNSVLFEVWMTSLGSLSDEESNKIVQKRNELVNRHNKMTIEDNDYIRSITYSTQKKDHYETRKKKVLQIIKEVINA